ncbi:hypothetical protein N2605_26935 [Bradyrhizobium yuanmingense]|uniref:hypothetical protein n=1 Tax=Bradyrhizobium yuanmingense TaxID=108015 RepID=UPI0021A8C5DC|nr:hypothetical protein [Bradyrhizobium sp. CB1024]UWU83160.1 hypothetical protein N2605_26935 [Bradyrhizobium sp. CB1024]
MARDIINRLDKLRLRRKGVDRLGRLNEASRKEILSKSAATEKWQTRAPTQAYTRYALGAMQEVEPEYTRISIETAERVGNQIAKSIDTLEFRIQGSVPLNIHIRGVSDVDLLALDTGFLVFHSSGPSASSYSPTARSSLGVLDDLRSSIEKILPGSFPAADVDTSGGKAIAISGGSLARPVDVVPSHWYDAYQQSRQLHERGVVILDRKVPKTIENFPFKHIKLIEDRCNSCLGGLRKAIRLCKNVKADAVEEGTKISFSSFDIAATMYHADQTALKIGYLYELRILAEVQRHLDYLYHNPEEAKKLHVPDGSRVIFDAKEKYEGMKALSHEIDDLVKNVAKEQRPLLTFGLGVPWGVARDAIDSIEIPG